MLLNTLLGQGKKKGQSEIKDLKKAMRYIGLLIEDIEKSENN
ncbi:hypothetical protein [Listeria phage LMTA-57]|uniref:DUF3310 domain-containing protein n=1 Tax=Listeria phage LMTA-57 TaxID=1486414 RepID=A0A068CC26_9CAUD|nr:hypothetical protein QLX42_gp005 [Listeria phage LMTA-57]AID17459.1 hypothetical protein [Listeria phage LMTA-57]